MAVNGHCSMEKDKNVFSLEALFRTFSPWARGLGWEASPWQADPRKEKLHLMWEGQPERGDERTLSVCLSVLGVHRGSPERGQHWPEGFTLNPALVSS